MGPLDDTAVEWVGLMRHGESFKAWMDGDETKKKSEDLPELTEDGARKVRAVADRLAATRDEYGEAVPSRITILCAPTDEAQATARAVAKRLDAKWVEQDARVCDLAPAVWSPYAAGDGTTEAWRCIGQKQPEGMLLVVGHDPQMSWLLHSAIKHRRHFLARLTRPERRLPLARGELAMLRRDKGRRWRLEWVLSPESREVISELQAKIKSKMDTAKVLGAFIVALITFAADKLRDNGAAGDWYPWVAGSGIALLAVAAGGYFATMFLYDRLLMPVRFWASPRRRRRRSDTTVLRPPSSAAWVLFQGMMLVWRRLFVPVTFIAAAGAALTGFALARSPEPWAFIAAGAAVIVATGILVCWATPVLGVSD